MVLFALMLPVMVAFLSLSLAASIELNTRASLDEAALTASIAASGDACMSSPYAFDLYECKDGNPNYSAIETSAGQLPPPSFTDASGQTSTYGDAGASTCMTYFCGNGSDGAVTLTVNMTLTRDMQYTTLVINGANINTNGYRILAKTSITMNGGKIYNNGGDASGTNGGAGAGGAISASGLSTGPWSTVGNVSVGGGYGGSSAPTVNGAPGNPSNPSASSDSLGGSGGSGDFPCAPSAGSGTTSWDDSAGVPNTNFFPSSPAVQLGGAGGGSGCSSSNGNGNLGGGGGGGGGVIVLASPSISFPGGGTLEATGGNGANGTLKSGHGNGGGGGGGGGGAALLISGNNPTGYASNFAGGNLGVNVQGSGVGSHGGHGGTNGGAGAGAIWVPNALSGGVSTAPTFHPVHTQCSGPSTTYCVIVEHDLALQSADAVVRQVLTADYPGYTIVTCPGENSPGTDGSPTTPPAPVTTSPAACAAMVTNSTTIVYQDQVSYWYYADTEDSPGGAASAANSTANNDAPTDDLDPGETLDNAGGGNADISGTDGGSGGALACPATNQLGRLVTVQVWTHFNNPFGGVLGIGQAGLATSASSYGCGGL